MVLLTVARRRVVGQLATAALRRYSPSIVAMVDRLADELLQTDTDVLWQTACAVLPLP